MKLEWRVASRENRMWANILRAKYLGCKSFFANTIMKGASLVWKGIVGVKDIPFQNTCFRIGSEININPWRNLWLPNLPSHRPLLWEGMKGRIWQSVHSL